MTDACNGIPVSNNSYFDAKENLTLAFRDAQVAGFLPPNAKLHYDINFFGIGVSTDGDILADPISVSCFNRLQIKSMMMHEVGHYVEPSPPFMGAKMEMQLFLAAAILATASFWAVNSAWRLARRAFGHERKKKIRSANLFAGFLIASTLNGVTIAFDNQINEKNADMFSARMMGSGEPLASALEDTRKIQKDLGATEYYMYEIYRAIYYGPLGFARLIGRDYIHPGLEERIAALRAYRPSASQASPGNPQLAR